MKAWLDDLLALAAIALSLAAAWWQVRAYILPRLRPAQVDLRGAGSGDGKRKRGRKGRK